MNLIEQLGGYEHLNGFYKRAVAHGFTLTEIKQKNPFHEHFLEEERVPMTIETR